MMELEPLGEIAVADSQFLGFCFGNVNSQQDISKLRQALKIQYPDAAHIPLIWRFADNSEGWDEDGEPPESVGPGVMKELKEHKSLAIGVVRHFGGQLLGITCGRLQQCYASIAKLTIHRHFSGKDQQPLEWEILQVKNNIYGLAAGDTELVLDVVDDPANDVLEQIQSELNFDGFRGAAGEVLPRLQNLQADLSDDIVPIYRYPGNYSGEEWETFSWKPFSLKIKKSVESALQPVVSQTMNHCVANLYRDGEDFIAHHSDKDLDLNREGVIVSVSLGDERIMEFKRRSEPKDVIRIRLPHRSMLVLGPRTNKQFSHSILPKEKDSKPRISLTLRDVKTFKDLKSGRLFGQGVADSKQSLQSIRAMYMVENTAFFGGFCALSAWMVSSKQRSTNGSLILAGIFATGTLAYRFFTNTWYKRREEQAARDFFSRTSVTGTKY